MPETRTFPTSRDRGRDSQLSTHQPCSGPGIANWWESGTLLLSIYPSISWSLSSVFDDCHSSQRARRIEWERYQKEMPPAAKIRIYFFVHFYLQSMQPAAISRHATTKCIRKSASFMSLCASSLQGTEVRAVTNHLVHPPIQPGRWRQILFCIPYVVYDIGSKRGG